MRIVALLALLAAACTPARGPPQPATGATGPDTAVILIRPRTAAPTPIQVAVGDMLRQCAGPVRRRHPMAIIVSDSLIALPSGRLLYGTSVLGHRGADTLTVLIYDAGFVHNVELVSHELLHAWYDADELGPIMRHCHLSVGVEAPERRVLDPWWHARRDDAVVVDLGRRR